MSTRTQAGTECAGLWLFAPSAAAADSISCRRLLFFFFAGGKTDASGSMDFPDLWWSHFPNHHQTVVDGLAVLLQSPLACQVTCV